ncbi:DUF192 domain-containing protein [Citreimonas sp.]|uniref:DUF192 domain-containing protein n=1 Tax=Citreimonas sp. TaxID=3036715 RepID=UPI004059F9C6
MLLSAATGAQAQGACAEDTIWLRGDFGQARFGIDVVDTPEGRARGLMFVEEMPRSRGMLFVYPDEAPVSFWMRNTLIPLDIIYADGDGVVINVAAEAIPGDETPLPSGGPAQYVLEINGGLAEAMGIGPGTQMRHPVIGPTPAWPC